ncbi:TolC family protein [Solimicrobium silvestre]|uniref:Outer membrane efflux protein n=1 Tax=Solimicrobium silvestre TaxID=2099400 RepID=A0A2S9GVQ5_9BURK|nr:TolC family protein [Solimicrobium silvestre]PRC91802.1 Outer membrane efflux protein [Solimicrobium silvestre]
MKKLFSARLVLASSAMLLSACSTFSTDSGFSDIAHLAQGELRKQVTWQRTDNESQMAQEKVSQLLAESLSVDDVVQIALLNNKELQANFYQLGIAEADFVQAGRMQNPGLTVGRLAQGGAIEVDRGLTFNLMHLLTQPYTRQMEQHRFEQTKQEVALQMLRLANETRKSYYMAVAANQTVEYAQQVQKLADAGSELGHRMQQVGNFNQLQQAREQGFYTDAQLTLARAEQAQIRAKEKLTRLLGLANSAATFILPHKLAELPASMDESASLEQVAMSQRIDIQIARLETKQLADNLGLNKATRFINVLNVGAERNTFTAEPVQRGYVVSLELPIFDSGDAKVAKAEAQYMQALNRTAAIAITARSEVREAYQVYRASFEIAKRYRDEIVPRNKRISEQNQLRYNGMLIDVFELLADARAQISSVNSAIEATRDFWLAAADLDMSLNGKPNQ